jgi:hypothetical protein
MSEFCKSHNLERVSREYKEKVDLVLIKKTCADCPYWKSYTDGGNQAVFGDIE